MPVYKTKFLDFKNSKLETNDDGDEHLVINEFKTVPSTDYSSFKSGIPVLVDVNSIVSTKRYTFSYITHALAKCKASNAVRLDEWSDIKACYLSLKRAKQRKSNKNKNKKKKN